MDPDGFDRDELRLDGITDPVEWFFAEHYRHRQFCHALYDAAATEVFDAERLASLIAFLCKDMAMHVIDEEEDLFPLLRRRALPEDEMEPVLESLSAEHNAERSMADRAREALESCLARRTAPGLDDDAREALQVFAAQELRHLAVENAVVLPIARLRLSPQDLRGLRRRIAARRGVALEAKA